MMMRAAVNAVNQRKELEGQAAEEFSCTFEKHTVRLAAAAKLQADNQKSLPPQLPTPLSEPNFRLFPNSNSNKRKMTAREAAEAAKGDKVRKQRREQKEKEIKQRYKAELAALNAEDPESFTPKPLRQVLPPMLVHGSQKELPIRLSSSPPPVPDRSSPAAPSPSECEILDQPRQSGRVKKPTRKIESQLRREAKERGIEEKKPKIRKSKFQKVPQLKDFLGSDFKIIE